MLLQKFEVNDEGGGDRPTQSSPPFLAFTLLTFGSFLLFEKFGCLLLHLFAMFSLPLPN